MDDQKELIHISTSRVEFYDHSVSVIDVMPRLETQSETKINKWLKNAN